MNLLVQLGEAVAFALVATRAAIAAFLRPTLWLKSLYDVLVGSLPLALVAGLAIGVVIWIHTRGVLERTGTAAIEFLPTFLAAAVLLELAPVGAGLILASRTAAKLGAELAAMKVNEQLDALAMLGVSPLKQLIGPRVLAATVAAPLLYVLIAALALGSGYLAEDFHGPTTWLRYSHAMLEGVDLRDVLQSTGKTIVFGWLAALAGCWMGVVASSGSEGVGRAATRSVVAAVLLVLAADVALVAIFRILS
jgi:phospholipid/cholesterol/gamma-HCH transport system permease protein